MTSKIKIIIAVGLIIFQTIFGCGTAIAYSDVSENDNPLLYRVTNTLSGMNVISGYPDGTFLPYKTVSRAEFAVVVIRLFGQEDNIDTSGNTVSQFTDTDLNWALAYIDYASDNSIVNGVGNGKFIPDGTVTYAQALKMLVCALGYGNQATQRGGWPDGYIEVGKLLGLMDLITYSDISSPCTRKDVAMMLVKAYEIDLTYAGTGGFIGIIDSEMGKRPTHLLDYVLAKYPDLNYVDYRDFSPRYLGDN